MGTGKYELQQLNTNMLPTINVVMLAAGFVVFFASGLGRGYLRSRLKESGAPLKAWGTLADDYRNIKTYLRLAKTHHFPVWPVALMVTGMVAVVMIFVAVVWRPK